jgi:hypothetical protein
MKGDSNVIWIVVGLILAIIILVLIISPLLRGQKTIMGTVGESDLRNCCPNYLASGRSSDALCHVPEDVDPTGQISVGDLCEDLGRPRECDPCGG